MRCQRLRLARAQLVKPGGADAWPGTTVAPSPGPDRLSCPSAALCVGAGSDIFTSTDPTGGAGAWPTTVLPGDAGYFINDVSCPSSTLCVATRGDGTVATSTNPAGGVSAWSLARIDRTGAPEAVFCSALPQCFITDNSMKVFASSQPTAGATAWTVSATTPAFSSGACPAANLCVAIRDSAIFSTTDPSAGPWKQTLTSGNLTGITCPSASLCLAVGSSGAFEISTNPAAGAWTSATIDEGRDLSSISCASVSLCVAVDNVGHVVTSTDPTGGPSTWTPALVDGNPCADTTPCSIEQILASAGSGVRTVDSSTLPGDGPYLTGLALNGDVLSWSHDGTPRSVTLRQPLAPVRSGSGLR